MYLRWQRRSTLLEKNRSSSSSYPWTCLFCSTEWTTASCPPLNDWVSQALHSLCLHATWQVAPTGVREIWTIKLSNRGSWQTATVAHSYRFILCNMKRTCPLGWQPRCSFIFYLDYNSLLAGAPASATISVHLVQKSLKFPKVFLSVLTNWMVYFF